MSERKRKRKKQGHADKHIALRVRQISVLLGGVLILMAATFWVTGMLNPSGTDTYSGKNPLMDPVLVDPALNAPVVAGATSAPIESPAVQVAIASPPPADETIAAVDGNTTNTPSLKNPPKATPKPTATSSSKPAEASASVSASPDSAATTANSSSGTDAADAAAPASPSTETMLEDGVVPASADWLELRIQKNIDDIDNQDLSDFRRIIQYLDQGYIGGLTADGLNSTEQNLLRDHLNSRLSAADYARSKELFSTYNYLLNEE